MRQSSKEGWPASEVITSAFVRDKEGDAYGVVIEDKETYGRMWPEVIVLRLKDVLQRIQESDIEFLEGRNVPAAIDFGMRKLGIAALSSLKNATAYDLSRADRLGFLAKWFNGGGGLPRNPDSEKVPLCLGHPALLNVFLNWLVAYLALHGTVDGRINPDNECMINCARQIKYLPNVRRF